MRHDRTLAAAGVQLVIPPVTLMLVTLAAQSAPFRFDFAGSARSG